MSLDRLFSDLRRSAAAISMRSKLQSVQIRCAPRGFGALWIKDHFIVGVSPLSRAFQTCLESVVLSDDSLCRSECVCSENRALKLLPVDPM